MKNKNKNKIIKTNIISKNKTKNIDQLKNLKQVEKWKDKFKDFPCFLIGNGPYLKDIDLSPLNNYLTIGINRAFLKIDPTILFWQDASLWIKEKKHVLNTKAIKLCRVGSGCHPEFYYFNLKENNHRVPNDPSCLYGRGSSGAVAFQLAYALGCSPIFLVGMDCRNDKEGNTDFYGVNVQHKKFTLPKCVEALQWIKNFKDKIPVINCSKNKVFEDRMPLEEAISIADKKGKFTREQLIKILMS